VYIGLFLVHIRLHIGLSPQHTHSRTSRVRTKRALVCVFIHTHAPLTYVNVCAAVNDREGSGT